MLESFNSSNFEYKKLTEEEQQKRGILGRLVGPIADFKNPTRNGRKYTEKLWEKVFSDPIVKEKIENKCLYGELGHPIDERLETDMTKICCCMSEQPKKSNDGKLYGVVDVIDTPNGRILKTLLDYGATVGISSRGEGDIIDGGYMGEEIVDPDTYQFEAFDIVLTPAVKSARLTPVTESLNNNKTLKQALLEDLNKSNDNDKLVMNETLESLGIKLNEGIQYKGYDMTITQSGVQLRKSDGTFVQEFPTEKEAKEYIDELNESLDGDSMASKIRENQDTKEMTRRAIKMLKNLGGDWEDLAKEFKDAYGEDAINESLQENSNESSIKDVDIKKQSEKEEADNDGDDLVAELQEALLKNADLEKIVKSLQEKLSVCYAKEKRFEGQVNTYKSSIKSLQENSKKSSSLEGKIKSLEEELEKCKSKLEKKENRISSLNESVREHRKQVEESENRISSVKEVAKGMTDKIQSLQEELEANKKSKETSIKALKESYAKKEEALNSKISDLQKDSLLKQKQLEEKLNRAVDETNKYKAIAQKAIDKYIVEKANALGISSDEVKNRLGKTYSFNDINSICESLSSSKIAIDRLPFRTSQISSMKVKESTEKPSINNYQNGDYVDEQLLRLMQV